MTTALEYSVLKQDLFAEASWKLPLLHAAISEAVRALRALDDLTADLEPEQRDHARVLFVRASSSLKKTDHPVARLAIKTFLSDLYEGAPEAEDLVKRPTPTISSPEAVPPGAML